MYVSWSYIKVTEKNDAFIRHTLLLEILKPIILIYAKERSNLSQYVKDFGQ